MRFRFHLDDATVRALVGSPSRKTVAEDGHDDGLEKEMAWLAHLAAKILGWAMGM
jgi:hypothetical protein